MLIYFIIVIVGCGIWTGFQKKIRIDYKKRKEEISEFGLISVYFAILFFPIAIGLGIIMLIVLGIAKIIEKIVGGKE